tara:strand:+ start:381 stop:695 length:315 start_codon:yes stop_codon:yes gene_type:complete
MYNKDCEICLGKGAYEVPNHRLEVMERIDCMDCLLDEQFKDGLKGNLTRLLTSTSKEKLATLVAEMIVNGVANNPLDDLSRIEGIIHTKNQLSALALGSAYANQ